MRYLAQLAELQVREHSLAEVASVLGEPGLFSLFLHCEHTAGEIGSRHLRNHIAPERGMDFVPHCSLFSPGVMLVPCSLSKCLHLPGRELIFFLSWKVHCYPLFLSVAPKSHTLKRVGDYLMSCHPHWLQKPIQVWPDFALYALLNMVKPEDDLFGCIEEHGEWPQRQ